MDIDVKNALNKLLVACDAIDAENSYSSRKIKNAVVCDIFSFIRAISDGGAEERIELFKTMYLDGDYEDAGDLNDDGSSVPASFDDLCRFDISLLKNGGIKTASLYIAFIVELGKHYLHSKYDKADIDQQKYLNYIRVLKARQNESQIVSKNEQRQVNDNPCIAKEQNSGNQDIFNIKKEEQPETSEPEETMEELLEELNKLIGLAGVKKEVTSLINLLKIKKIRDERGFETANVSKHLVFLGNPGTGKTTVARLLSKIYKQIGALEKGQLIEVDRAGLVAGHVGQTALKTEEKIKEAMGGILFIDEAYTLAKGGNDFGQEAIDTILKAMEDYRDNLVVIVAGYPEPMEKFLESNPGLKSRFNKNIMFEDYSKEELLSIFHVFCQPYQMKLSDDAECRLKAYLEWLVQNKDANFANGREMRNLFESALSNQANRLAEMSDITNEELNTIEVIDFPDWVNNSAQKMAFA